MILFRLQKKYGKGNDFTMNENEAKRLKDTELEMLSFVDKICRHNNLQYTLLYGTLLGAVRHGGFIPWDDDIDIGLLREDYDKLCNILEIECGKDGSKYFFQTSYTDLKFNLAFAKLRKNNTLFLEEDYDSKTHQGIFIDIFPLDYVKRKKGFQTLLSIAIHKLYKLSARMSLRSRRKVLSVARKMQMFYKKNQSEYVVCYGCWYGVKRDIHEIDIFESYETIFFEGLTFTVISKYNRYLTEMYGQNYMELPPIEERRNHSPKLVKFQV